MGLNMLNEVRWDHDTSCIVVLKNVDNFEWTHLYENVPQMTEKWPKCVKKWCFFKCKYLNK